MAADNMLLFAAGSLGRIARRTVDRDLRSIGLSSAQIRVLIFIARNDGAAQREIESELLLTRATVSAMVDTLASAGLIVRAKDEADGRLRRVVLTEKGHAKLAEARERTEAVERLLLSVISADEKDVYMDICRRLTNVLEESLC